MARDPKTTKTPRAAKPAKSPLQGDNETPGTASAGALDKVPSGPKPASKPRSRPKAKVQSDPEAQSHAEAPPAGLSEPKLKTEPETERKAEPAVPPETPVRAAAPPAPASTPASTPEPEPVPTPAAAPSEPAPRSVASDAPRPMAGRAPIQWGRPPPTTFRVGPLPTSTGFIPPPQPRSQLQPQAQPKPQPQAQAQSGTGPGFRPQIADPARGVSAPNPLPRRSGSILTGSMIPQLRPGTAPVPPSPSPAAPLASDLQVQPSLARPGDTAQATLPASAPSPKVVASGGLAMGQAGAAEKMEPDPGPASAAQAASDAVGEPTSRGGSTRRWIIGLVALMLVGAFITWLLLRPGLETDVITSGPPVVPAVADAASQRPVQDQPGALEPALETVAAPSAGTGVALQTSPTNGDRSSATRPVIAASGRAPEPGARTVQLSRPAGSLTEPARGQSLVEPLVEPASRPLGLPVPAASPPTPARPLSSDPNAPISTRPQSLDQG